MSTSKPRTPSERKRKNDCWIGGAQTYVDIAGTTRAVLIYECPGCWYLIGPIGCVGAGMEMRERCGKSENALKRRIEKELRDAGY